MADTQNDQVLQDKATTAQAAKQLGLEIIDVTNVTPSVAALELISEKDVREYRLMPFALEGVTLSIALADPSLPTRPAPAFLQTLKKQKGLALKLMLAEPGAFDALVARTFSTPKVSSASEQQMPVAESVPAPAPLMPVTPPASEMPNKPQTPAPQSVAAPTPSASSAPVAPIATSVPAPATAAQPSAMTQPQPKPQVNGVAATVPASVHSADIPMVDLRNREILRAHLERFPEDVATKYQIIVFELSPDEREASVAAVNPDDARVREILKFVEERNGVRIHLYRTDAASFAAAVSQYDVEKLEAQSKTTTPAAQPQIGATATELVEPSLQRASADQIRSEAKKPAPVTDVPARQPSAQEVPQTPQQIKPVSIPISTPSVQAPMTAPVPQKAPIQPDIQKPKPVTASAVAPLPTQSALPADDEQNLDKMLGGPVSDISMLQEAVSSGMVPRILAVLIAFAAQSKASDIHLEPGEQALRVRFRIDGVLQEIAKLPVELVPPVVSRIKILSRLKIDETRLPQDGRFQVVTGEREIDLRVSTLPAVYGEKVVLRLLDKAEGLRRLEDLGLTGTSLDRVQRAIRDPYGIILVTGPTGSGKTTTLYAMLSTLNTPEVNIVTLEDPVEYQIEGITQTQVRPKIGYSFADGLRSILRQDPNIIMVGEIRDRETAALATQAALTGHLVLATLHTNDAAGAIPRLLDMGVEPFLLASSLKAVIAQRLVRRLVPEKRIPANVPQETLEIVKAELAAGQVSEVREAAGRELTFYDAPAGDATAYKGRSGIYEVITVTETLAPLILNKAPASELTAAAKQEGMITLRQAGLLKSLSGELSITDVLQNTEA